MIGIYKITSPNNRVYIGQSVNIYRRFATYKLNKDKGKQPRLYGSFKKYGVENHIFEVIEECSIDLLNERERYWQDFYNVLEFGLNCVLTKTSFFDYKIRKETSEKLSKIFKGRIISLETRKKLSLAHTGKKLSFEHKEKLRLMLIGRKGHTKKATEETKEKCRLNSSKHLSKIVLDINTGVFYESAKEVSDLYGFKQSSFRGRLNGNNPNKTPFIYV